MENKIRLVVCDIDDTLVHKELHLSPKIIHIIGELRRQNVYFTFATGRMPYRAEIFAREAGLDIPYVANNGSILYDRGRVIYSKLLKASVLKEPLRKFMRQLPELTVIFSYMDRERPLFQTPWIKERLYKYAGYDQPLGDTEEVWSQEVHKVYVVDNKCTGLIGRAAAELECLKGELSFFQYGEYSMEIVAKDCSKASGVKRLIGHLGLREEQVMAVGDHTNDMEVVSMAGIGVAVNNADPKLKAAADYVTDGQWEDGVIEAVNRFVLKTEEKQDGKNNG